MRRTIVLSSVVAVLVSVLPMSAASADPTTTAEITIATKIEHRLQNTALGNDTALLVQDAHDGRTVVAVDADEPQLPASNMKVITATNVLTALGPDHRFTTSVRLNADGTLVLVGGGDPLLDDADLAALAEAVTTSRGTFTRVGFDDSLFTGRDLAPGWPGGYVPSVVSPVRALAKLWDYSTTPEVNATKAFLRALKAKGVKAPYAGRVTATGDVVATTVGHKVRECVKVMLRVSENNVAEVLFRHVALAQGKPANWAGARAAATEVLSSLGVDTTGLQLKDGSGLSRSDRLTPTSLVSTLMLSTRKSNTNLRSIYFGHSLPTAGESGTLDAKYGRYASGLSKCARGKVFAKTGTLFDTIGLSGITNDADGSVKVFSILVNDRPQNVSALTTRRAVDVLAATITGCA